MSRRHLAPTVLILAAGLFAGCATSQPAPYEPRPASLTYRPDDDRGVRVLATLMDTHEKLDTGQRVALVRLRIDNAMQEPVTVRSEGLQLISADLETFQDPELRPDSPVTVQPGNAAVAGAVFPYPAGQKRGEINLGSLALTVTMEVGDRQVSRQVIFREIYRDRYYPASPYSSVYPYYGPSRRWSVGAGYRF
ncbi:MAG: hypothetical protein ACLFV3_08285 [Phycisphaeraceae bacterium]